MKILDLKKMGACKVCIDYFNSQPDPKTAWNNLERGDWGMWIANKLGVDKDLLRYVSANTVRQVRPLMKAGINRDFIDFLVEKKGVENAGYDAAVYAAFVADAAVAYATYTADVADADSAAAAADAADAAVANRLLTANICKEHLTKAVFEKMELI